MDDRSARQEERTALKRIVARLLSLADAADFACRCPHPVRVLILFILRYAERVAWDFVTGEPQHPHEALPHGDSPQDAALLAQRFRELACLLDWQINCEAALEAFLPGDPWSRSRLPADTIKPSGVGVDCLAHPSALPTPRATGPPGPFRVQRRPRPCFQRIGVQR